MHVVNKHIKATRFFHEFSAQRAGFSNIRVSERDDPSAWQLWRKGNDSTREAKIKVLRLYFRGIDFK